MGVNYDICRYTGKRILRPGLKLIGAKTKTRDFLYSFFPEHSVYVEPFMGTAGVLVGKPKSEHEYIGDLNWYAINYYTELLTQKYTTDEFWANLQICLNWLYEDPEYHFQRMKELILDPEVEHAGSNQMKAIYFYCITKHCFNGIWRLNAEGKCNSSWGGTIKGRGIFTEEWFLALRERLKDVVFLNMPYQQTLVEAFMKHKEEQAFVFLDPPYHDCKTTYNGESWNEVEYIDLYTELSGREFKWMLTINDHPFIRELFAGYEMVGHDVFYSCSQTTAGRGKLPELIIGNYDLVGTHQKYVKLALDGKKETETRATRKVRNRRAVDRVFDIRELHSSDSPGERVTLP